MSDSEREQEYRLSAAECFTLAREADDEATREKFLRRAREWVERADRIFIRRHLGRHVDPARLTGRHSPAGRNGVITSWSPSGLSRQTH
jgi:hypothetical protein